MLLADAHILAFAVVAVGAALGAAQCDGAPHGEGGVAAAEAGQAVVGGAARAGEGAQVAGIGRVAGQGALVRTAGVVIAGLSDGGGGVSEEEQEEEREEGEQWTREERGCVSGGHSERIELEGYRGDGVK